MIPFGTTSINVPWTEPTATDNSGMTPTVTQSHQPGDSFNAGITQVVYTFTDVAGNQATCSFSVTIGKSVLKYFMALDVLYILFVRNFVGQKAEQIGGFKDMALHVVFDLDMGLLRQNNCSSFLLESNCELSFPNTTMEWYFYLSMYSLVGNGCFCKILILISIELFSCGAFIYGKVDTCI